MRMNRPAPKDIDGYIEGFPSGTQSLLQKMRRTIQKAAPMATEAISYRIPTFLFHGSLVHFAAYAHHIGFYPTSSGVSSFRKELASYKTSRGAIRFPLNQPLPLGLITRIVRFRVWEVQEKKAIKDAAGKEPLVPGLSAPALRALKSNKITTLKKLAGRTEKEVLSLHGIGISSIPPIRRALRAAGLAFRSA